MGFLCHDASPIIKCKDFRVIAFKGTTQSNTAPEYTCTVARLPATIENNTIENKENGIYVAYSDANGDGSSVIKGNVIKGNSGYGIRVESYAKPVISLNDIENNSGYFVDNQTEYTVDARNNWWGETLKAVIESGDNPRALDKFYDQFDDSTKGLINYAGWLEFSPNSVKTEISNIFKVATLDGANAYWDASTDSSVKGYWVFYGVAADGTYDGYLDAGNLTEASLTGAQIDTKIAVRAYTTTNATVPVKIEGFQQDRNLAKKGFAVLAPIVGSGTVTLNPNPVVV